MSAAATPMPSAADQRDSDKAILAARRAQWMRRMAATQRNPQDRHDALHYAAQYEAEVVTLADAIIGRAAAGQS